MIINCRPSVISKFTVVWKSFELVDYIMYKLKQEVMKEKSFDTFADANGFAIGLVKRGIVVDAIIPS